jgi:hypothetical protein
MAPPWAFTLHYTYVDFETVRSERHFALQRGFLESKLYTLTMPPQKYKAILYQQEASYFGGIVNVYKVLPKYT